MDITAIKEALETVKKNEDISAYELITPTMLDETIAEYEYLENFYSKNESKVDEFNEVTVNKRLDYLKHKLEDIWKVFEVEIDFYNRLNLLTAIHNLEEY